MSKLLKTFLIITIAAFSLTSCTVRHIARLPDEPVIYDTPSVPQHLRANIYHSVAPGETLWRISKMYEVDIDTLAKVNQIRDARDIEIGEKLLIPGAAPRKHVVTLYPSKKWKYIIVHHSATGAGNSTEFNKAHKDKGWDGVGYHFIIDNGTSGKDNGQIETTPRWLNQSNGAHCKADNMNERGIGICLVGNFSRENVSPQQMASLVYLVETLRQYYKIPKKNVIGHGDVSGAQTECPGTRFPWRDFSRKLGR